MLIIFTSYTANISQKNSSTVFSIWQEVNVVCVFFLMKFTDNFAICFSNTRSEWFYAERDCHLLRGCPQINCPINLASPKRRHVLYLHFICKRVTSELLFKRFVHEMPSSTSLYTRSCYDSNEGIYLYWRILLPTITKM